MIAGRLILKLVFLLVPFVLFAQQNKETNYTQYVNPFIGSQGEGNVFVGACKPFGMVKLGPDYEGHSNSGYIHQGRIEGFSHTHTSGTGGGAKYGNILLMPRSGDVASVSNTSMAQNEQCDAGYYSVYLQDSKVKAELTASHSVGFHRYTFDNEDGQILIDAGHHLYTGRTYGSDRYRYGEAQYLVGSEINIVSPSSVSGFSRVRNGWNLGGTYTVYFYAVFDSEFKEHATWEREIDRVNPDNAKKAGATFSFEDLKNKSIQVKVGISFISIEKARQNIEKEIPHWDFEKVYNESRKTWNDMLSSISIEGGTLTQKRIFYTGLYHTMLMPTDRTGENPLWYSKEPYYDDFYAIWDTYRTTNPLFTLIQRDRQRDMIRSLIDTYKHEGYMPDARSGNYTGRTQGGSNCDMLITEAYLKGIKGIDYELAYEAMIKNAEVDPGDDHEQKGRGGIDNYKAIGYVPAEHYRSASRTVEYCANDYAIAQLAKAMKKEEDVQKYVQRSSNWQNLWRETKLDGFTGFIWPRYRNGEWKKDHDPMEWGYWDVQMYEGSAWDYSFYVPHDVNKLIQKSGGNDEFIRRLDHFFDKKYFNVTNEPDFLTPCLYLWTGRYDKTAERIKEISNTAWSDQPDGIPGNDDSGAMSAWWVFHSMGFFPVAGQDVYLITTPVFEKSILRMQDNKMLTIQAKNLNDKNIYVQKAFLNGKPLNRAWFRHQEIIEGAVLEFVMGASPTDWGTDPTLFPPSLTQN